MLLRGLQLTTPLLALSLLFPSASSAQTPAATAPTDPTEAAQEQPAKEPPKKPTFTFTEDDLARFQVWLEALRVEARERGIQETTITAALSEIRPIDRIIALDRRQPEGSMSWETYRSRTVTSARVAEGRRLLEENREVLEQVAKQRGVQPRFIVALWGIESGFGSNTGGFSVITALATLAFEGRRGAFFRKELFRALKIIDEGHISAPAMKGSWAGAMGQCQFMPSSFSSWAVDQDGDGKKDIWNTRPDVFGSTANYLHRNRWDPNRTWGRRVKIPEDLDPALIGKKIKRTLAEWQSLGVRRQNGKDLPLVAHKGALVQPGGPKGPTYLAYGNYQALLHWNRSLYFATAVGLLADRIGAP